MLSLSTHWWMVSVTNGTALFRDHCFASAAPSYDGGGALDNLGPLNATLSLMRSFLPLLNVDPLHRAAPL